MRFLLNENIDTRVAVHLRNLGHDATTVAEDYTPQAPDADVLSAASAEHRIIVTLDYDYGALIFRQHHPHAGVIFLRGLGSAPLSTIIARLDTVIRDYRNDLAAGRYITVTRGRIRVAAS